MGSFRENIESSESPIMGTLSWNAKQGKWFYISHSDENGSGSRKMIIDSFSAIFLEPSTFCVTGKKFGSEVRHNSNLAKRDDYDDLHVRASSRIGNANHVELVASGPWKNIKDTVKNSGGRWTLSPICWVIAMKGQDQDANGNLVGDKVTVQWGGQGQIMNIRLRGGAIAHAWSMFEEKSNVKQYNMDGLAFSTAGSFEKSGDSGTFIYPTLDPIGYVTEVDKLKKYAVGCKELYTNLQAWLKGYWERIENKYGIGAINKPGPAPESKPVITDDGPSEFDNLPVSDDAGMDDDLPF